jgi:hypothetical protein
VTIRVKAMANTLVTGLPEAFAVDLFPQSFMTKPRRKPATQYHAFIVEPMRGFRPRNWQDKPTHYRILEFLGPKRFKGRADAWKFLHNHQAIEQGDLSKWAIYID